MGGLAERTSRRHRALVKRDKRLAQQNRRHRPRWTSSSARSRKGGPHDRAAPADGQDLRDVIAAIHIANDLERVGDLVKNIAKRVLAIEGQFPPQKLLRRRQAHGRHGLGQFKAVLDAYTQRDAQAALAVWEHDGDIDALYNSLFRELLTYMMEDPRNIGFCTHLLFSAKNIERIGDHATNIAETVYYLVTGQSLSVDRPEGRARRPRGASLPLT